MAAKNEVMARATVTIGGVTASKKNLEELKDKAEQFKDELKELKKQYDGFINSKDPGNLKSAAEIQAKMRKIEAAIKANRTAIRNAEYEVQDYTKILEELSGSTVVKLNKAAKDLQEQMKHQITSDDTNRWKTLNAAYKQVMQTMEQLNGKAPNLNYVMQNIGKVSKQSLSDTVQYLEKLINSTDRTTKAGISSIKEWKSQLKQVQTEQKSRAVNAIDKPTGNKEDLVQAIKQLQTMQAPLKETSKEFLALQGHIEKGQALLKSYSESFKTGQMESQMKNLSALSTDALTEQRKYWQTMMDGASRGTIEFSEYEAKIKQVTEEERKRNAARSGAVMDNLTGSSVKEINQAIEATRQLRDAQTLGSDEWKTYNTQIETATKYLKDYENQTRQRGMESQLQNIGQLSASALSEQKKYWQEVVNGTDASDDKLSQYIANLKQVTEEEKTRSAIKADEVMGNLQGSTVSEINQAIEATKKLRDEHTLGSRDWADYNNQIEEATQYLRGYDEQIKNATMEGKLQSVTSLSKEALSEQKKYWQTMVDGAERGSTALSEYEKNLKTVTNEEKARLENRALAANSAISGGTFSGTEEEAKQAIETLREYRETLNFSTQSDEIANVTQTMEAYNEVLNKIKNSSLDVAKVLSDPKSFSAEKIEQAIKQIQEESKKITIGDPDSIKETQENIDMLKSALADIEYSAKGLDNIEDRAKSGSATIEEMETAVKMLNDKLRKTPQSLTEEIEEIRRKLDVINPALAQTRSSISNVQKTLEDIDSASINSLKEAAASLESELKNINGKTDEFVEKSEQLKEVKERIKEMEGEWSTTASTMDNAISRLKSWVLVYASASKAGDLFEDAYHSALEMSDLMADVQKITGMASDEVVRLTENIQKIDTRISNEDLLKSATEGGRLGLKGIENIEAFTKASAITLTALDELDAKSVTSVMKLNDLLGETDKLGVQQAILSTASSINELSIASAASQQPIIDFSRRFGGIAAQANISTADVMALGATIDALGQPIEMSSTALNKFTTALLSNGKQIAEDTGLSEDYIFEMTEQGKTMELMIQVLSRLREMGGIGEISKYIGDMGGEGARMTAVISALAANLDFMQQQIKVSNTAFEDGVSVINEYNLKNENAAALVERIGNHLKEAFVNPTLVGSLTWLLRWVEQFVSWITSGSSWSKVFNIAMVLLATSMTKGLNATKYFLKQISLIPTAVGLAVIEIRKLTAGAGFFGGAVKLATAAVKGLAKGLWSLLASNPLGWVMIGIMLLKDFGTALGGAKDKADGLSSAMDRANAAFGEEKYKLDMIKKSLDAAKDSKGSYAGIINKLNLTYSKHIGYLLSEAAGYREIAGAIDIAVSAKRREAMEQERTRNYQNVQDKYRDKTNSEKQNLRNGIDSYFGSFNYRFVPKELKKDLYSSINKELLESSADGGAEIGEKTSEILRSIAEMQVKEVAEKWFEALSPEQRESELNRRTETLKNNLLNDVSAIKKLGSIYVKSNQELNELDNGLTQQIDAENKRILKMKKDHAADNEEEHKVLSKEAKDFSTQDEENLDAILKQYEGIYKDANAFGNSEEAEAALQKVKEAKAKQREVLLTLVDNPLRGVKLKVGEDGKFYKELSKDGKVQYEAIQNMSDANLKMLRDAYLKSEKNFQTLSSDNNNLMDSKVREAAKTLSKLKTAIKDELAKNGIAIDEKGDTKLRDTEYRDKSTRSGASREESEMKKAYHALLNNIQEFYDKQKVLIYNAYLANQMTVEEKEQTLQNIEKGYLQTRVAMQRELLQQGNDFQEDLYIRDLNNYVRVKGWMLKETHHFQDEVRKDAEVSNKKLTDIEIKHKEEVEKIILDKDIFEQLSRSYQQQLEKLDLFFRDYRNITEMGLKEVEETLSKTKLEFAVSSVMVESPVGDKDNRAQDKARDRLQDIGESVQRINEALAENDLSEEVRKTFQETKNQLLQEAMDLYKTSTELSKRSLAKLARDGYSVTQAQASDFMRILSQSAANATDMSYETFKAQVESNKQLQQMFQEQLGWDRELTETDWKAIYEIVMRYNNDITEKRVKMYNDNRAMIDKIAAQDDGMKELGKSGKQLKEEEGVVKRKADNGLMGRQDTYNNKQAGLAWEIGLEAATYQRRLELETQFWDNKISATKKGTDMYNELTKMKNESLEQLGSEHAAKNKELEDEMTQNVMDEYERRLAIYQQHGEKVGEFLGVMASANWNSVEDRKKAGEELLRYIATETAKYIQELAMRAIKEKLFHKLSNKDEKKTQEDKRSIVEQGGNAITNAMGNFLQQQITTQETMSAQAVATEQSAAATSAGINVAKSQVDVATGIASGTAKEVSSKGLAGLPAAAIISAALSMLLNLAINALSSQFGKKTKENKSQKRLAAGMLTYAEGRYPVQGNDGETYNAQYEPVLQTKIYQGGKNKKAHFGIFSERMPEMVVSGPTTKIIQENYPEIMNAIMTVERHGRLRQAMPVFADGSYPSGQSSSAGGGSNEMRLIASSESNRTNEMLSLMAQTLASLNDTLTSGKIKTSIDMYGKKGLKEQVSKADSFYRRNNMKG